MRGHWTREKAREAAGPGEVVVRRMVEATNEMMANYPMFFVEPAETAAKPAGPAVFAWEGARMARLGGAV